MCDYVGNTPVELSGESRHGRALQLRVEEVLGSMAVDYELDYVTYLAYYSARSSYFNDMDATRSILYDKIPRSAFAWHMLM